MRKNTDIESLLRRSSVESPPVDASLIEEICSQIVEGASSERQIRKAAFYRVIPISALVSLLAMWLAAVPVYWMAIAFVGNAALIVLFLQLVKRLHS